MENYLFYAEIAKGYCIKTLIDGLSGTFNRCFFKFLEDGIYIKQIDDQRSIFFNIILERKHFMNYHCEQEFQFSLNIKHFQRNIKTFKKKNSLSFFIERDRITDLGTEIKPNVEVKTKIKRNYITIKKETPDDFEVPTGYKNPKVINSTDFQDIKGIINISRELIIKIQKTNYISFSCKSEIDSSEISIGELVKGDVYESKFYSSMFNQIIKLPSLSPQIQFYIPPMNRYPLKIEMQVGSLGSLEIFLKDIQELENQKLELEKVRDIS